MAAFKQLDTIWCPVSDMDRAVAFYRDMLGLQAGYTSEYWTSIPLGNGQQIGLHGGGVEGSGGGFVVSFVTDDLIGLKTVLTEAKFRSGDYHDTPRGVVMDVFDPDGNRLQAMQLGAKTADLG